MPALKCEFERRPEIKWRRQYSKGAARSPKQKMLRLFTAWHVHRELPKEKDVLAHRFMEKRRQVYVDLGERELLRRTEYVRSAKVRLREGAVVLLYPQHKDSESEFNELVREWKSIGRAKSFISALAMHPAYQRIIGMGPKALPWILRELEKQNDHWFWALKVDLT